MSRQPFATVLQQVRQFAHNQDSDAWLLERFLGQRDGNAFAALVERHGPLVLGVCRRILSREQDVEDAGGWTLVADYSQTGFATKEAALGAAAAALPWFGELSK